MDTMELIRKAHEGDKDARDRLVTENLGLIWSVVKRFTNRGHEPEDLFQIGSIGLIKAIDKFDTNFDVKFSTYAVPMIMGEIKRFLRDDGMIKVSRSLKETASHARSVSEQLGNSLGREPTIDEVASAMELPVEDIVIAFESISDIESIYKTIYKSDGNDVFLVDKILEEKDENEELLNHILIEQMMDKLPQNEKEIIFMRYFMDNTQTQVAERLGISQVQVSRLEKKILKRMRENLE